MVGTAEYQVGLASLIWLKNFSALKPGEQKIVLPAAKGASKPAIKPWMWNSGMMFKPQSAAVRFSVLRTLTAEAHTFLFVSGTILGREVVPEVCRIKARSSASEKPGCAAGLLSCAWPAARVNAPAPSLEGDSSTMRTPSFSATARAALWLPRSTIKALALRSDR